jgi:hypothetical protein
LQFYCHGHYWLARQLDGAERSCPILKQIEESYHWSHRDEMGNRYNVRLEGTRVRHSMGMVSIKPARTQLRRY